MNTGLSPSATCFVGLVNGELACFSGIIPLPLRAGVKRFHRLVVLPEFQGIGLGTTFIDEISRIYVKKGWDIVLTTTTPSLIYSLDKNDKWSLYRKGRPETTFNNLKGNELLTKTASINRVTFSFKYIPDFTVEKVVKIN